MSKAHDAAVARLEDLRMLGAHESVLLAAEREVDDTAPKPEPEAAPAKDEPKTPSKPPFAVDK